MDDITPLLALGLNELEARIYIQLLSKSPATGYQIAQRIGKPVANCYKALEMLVKKGVIEADDGDKRLYSPSPPSEFLQRWRQRMEENVAIAERQLRKIRSVDDDLKIYQMTNVDQVFERSKTLLRNARKAVVADLYPAVLRRLSTHLERTGKRRIQVSIKCYENESIRWVQTVTESRPGHITAGYPGQWLKIVADAREHVIAFLSEDLEQIYQAVWSKSPFLSILHFNAIRSEMLLDQINSAVTSAQGFEDIKRIISPYDVRAKQQLPGYADIVRIPSKRNRGKK